MKKTATAEKVITANPELIKKIALPPGKIRPIQKQDALDVPANAGLPIPANSNLPQRVFEIMDFMQQIEGAPMRDRIMVLRADPKQAIRGMRLDGTPYEIIIPDIAQETQGVGIVIAIGSGHYLNEERSVPLDVTPGQIVFFNKYAGTETYIGKYKVLRLREEEIEWRANGEKCMALAKHAEEVRAEYMKQQKGRRGQRTRSK
jgi:co-chaperonin GroES (HSP10)